MMFCLGRRKSLFLFTCLVLFLVVMSVTHFLSPPILNREDFISARDPVEEPGPGGSWRLISHEVEVEDEVTAKPISKVSFKKSPNSGHQLTVVPPVKVLQSKQQFLSRRTTHLLCKGKYHCTDDLLFCWIGLRQTSKYVIRYLT